jgi:putative methyltransferase (TIGR04325 family)
MAKIKDFIKEFVPPIIISSIQRYKFTVESNAKWSGNYASWVEARSQCTGYDSEGILEKCKNSLLKVKNGEAVYERDSVLFDEIQYSWGLLAGLQSAALENDGKLCVLDFGGSLGSTYYQNKKFLSTLQRLEWCIVEQRHFVDCGKEFFENEQLKFFYTLEDCIAKYEPNVLVLSSVLQYLENPYDLLEKCIGLGIPNIIIDRTAFIEGDSDILAIQNVPESIYKASYPVWFFRKSLIDKKLREKYECVGTFSSHEGYIININNIKSHYKGMIWKIR